MNIFRTQHSSRRCTGFDNTLQFDRRGVLQNFGMGLGGIALAELLTGKSGSAAGIESAAMAEQSLISPLLARAKRVIYLFQSGGPSQMDLYDYKPLLNKMQGQELPPEVRKGQRLTAMSGNQATLPLVGSPFQFQQHGESGAW